MDEENYEIKKSISLAENNDNKTNNYNSRNIKMNGNEIEEKLEIIIEDKNNESQMKEIEYINDRKKCSPILIINNGFDFKYNRPLSLIFPVGLKNLGNSCFLNSCLQCFYHCPEFTSELLESYQKYEKIKGTVLLAYLETLKNLYTNGKEFHERKAIRLNGVEDEYEFDYGCCCRKKKIKNNNKVIYYNIGTNPASAAELYSYILGNNANLLYNGGSDPKIVAEMILSTMNKEINPNFKYVRNKEIPKSNEILLFEHIFNYYENNKTIISSNFYWIKERISICNECEKETYNFQSDYILYFYPEAIINGLNLKIDNNENKYKISLDNCFEYFHISEQLDINLFTCYSCNKRVKAKSILTYMTTLPKYLVLCICKDKDEQNPIDYILDYNQEIDLEKYYKKQPKNNYSTKYKFHSGCFLNYKNTHAFAICFHFDGFFYQFDDSFYQKYDFEQIRKSKFEFPYLLIYKRYS